MKNNIFTIMKKELARFFGDKRMVFTTLLVPGLMIYIIYSFMGDGMMENLMADDTYVVQAYVRNMPEELSSALEELPVEWTELEDDADQELIRQEIQNKEADVLVVFPEEFVSKVNQYDVSTGEAAPNVEIYYNSANTESANFRSVMTNLLNAYESSMANKLDVNAGELPYDCASEKDVTAQIFSMMLPMLLMTFLYSGCVAVAPESIAGEKERGTIATLLVTPVKRSSLALGKVFSLSIIALLSGFSSFLGTFLSLPKLMGGEVIANVYAVTDYVMLLGVVLSTVLLLVSMIAVLSALAKSIKEAGTMVSPLMIVVMFISILPMFAGEGEKAMYHFFIPLNNSAQCMHGIFSFTYDPMQIVIAIIVNLVAASVMSIVLTKLFSSEKVMFGK